MLRIELRTTFQRVYYGDHDLGIRSCNKAKDEQRMVPSPRKMKLLCVALAFQALLALQVHCAGKKAASSEPKVTSQVRVWS